MPTTTDHDSSTTIARSGGRITVKGDLTYPFRQLLKQEVLDALRAGEMAIVVDFTGSEYIDSSGLGVLVSCKKACHLEGATLQIAGLNEPMRNLFTQTRLDTILTLVEPRT